MKSTKSPLTIIFLGKPASGKGTQADLLKKKFSLFSIDSGEILRKLIKENHPFKERILRIMEKGELVPLWLVVFCWLNELLKVPKNQGVIFEGSPRQLEEAKILLEVLDWLKRKKVKAIYLDVSDKELIKRVKARYFCPNCLKEYSLILNPEIKKDLRCLVCHSKLTKRPDDNLKAFNKRLKDFYKTVYPVINFFKKQKILVKVKAEGTVEEIFQRILEKL